MNLSKTIRLFAKQYKNLLLIKLKGYEIFVDEGIIRGDSLGFDGVIRIKDDSKFFNYGNGRLHGVLDLFTSDKGLWIQFVGIDNGIWLAVLDVDRIDCYSNSYITYEEHQRRLEMACHTIEAFARQIDSNASVFASVCNMRELLGKVVLEIWNVDKYDDSKLPPSELKKIKDNLDSAEMQENKTTKS